MTNLRLQTLSLTLFSSCISCNNSNINTDNFSEKNRLQIYARTSSVLIERELLALECINKDCNIITSDGWGSGVIIYSDKNKATVLTADHICNIHDNLNIKLICRQLIVTDIFMGKSIGTIKHSDQKNDICLIEFQLNRNLINRNLPAVRLSPIEPIPGEKVINIGSPDAFFQNNLVIIQEGYYNGLHMFNNLIPIGIYTLLTFSGSSGSMILNYRGELIGMVHSAYKTAPIITRSPGYYVLKSSINSYIQKQK